MSDLISRNALLSALTDRDYIDESIVELVVNQPAARVSVVANISGGVLQGASATHEGVDVYALDFDDVPDDDPEVVILLDGEEVRLGQEGALYEPNFVREVIDAPTLADV